ncbi:ion transporter [Francisella philomiragia]|uniref:Ion transport family protein n=2 Tax=Francisella philomiragia TaxID=28110 RepID=A0AAW3DAI7_9GAMM|nr:ion transporter [Francisella philomiragia]AJI46778.1 ion transport family protein [Francisella philomiragia]AJI49063.1 ion transport family protein [Francisella philomiragia]KFJ42337.1 ion transport family protein [Francisella philomiragia]MBK2019760.1 ion transporter [Francisella philomiragia]MBK2025636.1 ion transporter [Francisella philomiragia]
MLQKIYQSIIIVFVVINSFTLIAQIDYGDTDYLNYINITFSAIFSIEYIIRLIIARRKLVFIFSFYNVIDFIAIFLPLILSLFGINSHELIVLRLLRVFKIFQNTAIMNRLINVFKKIYLELLVSYCLIFVILIISCILMFYAEHEAQPQVFSSISNTLWWGVITLTTVGYGDMYPITLLGRLIAAIVSMLGIGVFAIPSGLIGGAFIDEIRQERELVAKNKQKLE